MKNLLKAIKYFFLSEQFVVIFTVVYILIIGIILITELNQSSLRATEQVILLLLVSCIPILLIPAWLRIAGKISSIKIMDIEINLKDDIKKQVASELVENITATTETTVYSLASSIMVEPTKVSVYQKEPRDEPKSIIVGCQDYTEQRVLCAIITQLLERENGHNHKIIPKYNFGGAGLNFIALSRGDIDIYPAYTWQGLEMVYATSLPQRRKSFIEDEKPNKNEAKKTIEKLNDIYKRLSIPLEWICYTGFYDNWSVVVRKKYAEKMELTNVSDLEEKFGRKNLPILGCEYDFFARPNGCNLLTNDKPNGYGIKFEKITLIQHIDAYKALDNEEVNVIDGFTTDREINNNKYQQLIDNEGRFGRYYSSILARQGILDDNVKNTLQKLEDKIEVKDMSEMISKVDSGKESLIEVAINFISNKLPRN